LTTLGILIGIAAVVTVTALGSGARERIGGQIENLGSNLLFVFNQSDARSGARQAAGAGTGLRQGDADAIRREATAVKAVTVYSSLTTTVASSVANAKTSVAGVDRSYFEVRGFRLRAGRTWTDSEERIKTKVCLLGQTVANRVFPGEDPVGRTVRIGKHAFRVIGTLQAKGQSPWEDQDDRVLVPIATWRARVSPTLGDRVQIIMATAQSTAATQLAERQVEDILRQRHRIEPGQDADFRIRTQEQFRSSQQAIFGTVTLLFIVVAAIALCVGGVGVMNVMLVSVTERTREIGIRMAIGAKRSDIQRQFLLEAVGLTVSGGVLGTGLAAIALEVMKRNLGWSLPLPMEAVMIALATSVTVGLLFGLWPARRAADLDPIEALRQE
jgi:putative ABC transport system permease protein